MSGRARPQRSPMMLHHFLACLLLLAQVTADNLLIVHPFYCGSHVLTVSSISKAWIDRGHKVTTVRFEESNTLPLTELGPNHTEILLRLNNSDGTLPWVTKEGVFNAPMDLLWKDGLHLETVFTMPGNPWDLLRAHCKQILGDRQLSELLRKQKFDVALVELLYNECSLAMVHDLGIPTVGYWFASPTSGEIEFTTIATPPSHIPVFMSGNTDNMSFWSRVHNFCHKIFARLFMVFHTWTLDWEIQKYLPNSPSSAQLIADINGALLYTTTVLDYPRLQPDNFINVAGFQAPDEVYPLPKDLSDFMEGAEHGVVFFSMGLMFQPDNIPQERIDIFLSALARLPQRVLLKFPSPLKNLPPNIMQKRFLPQRDVLAHPKTVVFFTHFGYQGVSEALLHAVPMVGMPIFADQKDIAVKAEDKGIGLALDKFASSEEIYQAIMRVINDRSYQDRMSHLSRVFRQRRRHPMESALDLLEFVSETKGADHLRLASRHLNFWQYHSLDVALFLATLLAAAAILCRGLWRLCRRKRKSKRE